MKRLTLLLFTVGMLLSITPTKAQELTLKHSYDFKDGTADDIVGTANGTVMGGAIENGVYTASANGDYIQLPASDIKINEYSEITIEAYVSTVAGANTGFTMLFYFGETNSSNHGSFSFFGSIARGDDVSKAALSTVESEPYNYESGPTGTELDDGAMHHMVVTVNATEISMYLDGVLAGTEALSEVNSIDLISTVYAYIGKGGYTSDPTWIGSVIEYNIYSGIMDATTVANHYLNFPLETNATLDTLYSNIGTLSPAFDAFTTDYELFVPYGTTSISISAISNTLGNVISMNDGQNDLDPANITFDENGVLVEIIVEALDGSERTYYLDIFVDDPETSALLTDITLSTGELSTTFSSLDTAYASILPYNTTSVEVTGVPANSGATVTGGGTIDMTSGKAFVTLSVTSEDKSSTKEYTVDLYVSQVGIGADYYFVNEAADYVLTGEPDMEPTLENALTNDQSQIWNFVESGVENQYYIQNTEGNYLANRPITDGGWHFIMRSTLTEDLDSCRFEINEFEPGRFYIYSVIRMLDQIDVDDASKKIMMGPNDANLGTTVYSDKWTSSSWHTAGLTVWNILPPDSVVEPYDTYLGSLSTSVGSISPEFDPFVTDYNVVFPIGTTSVEITASPNDATSSVSGAGSITLDGSEGTITLTVTASNTDYQRTYTINYLVNSDLELKHQYTFANGTAKDMVGNADGKVMGGVISEGVYFADSIGYYIDLPGDSIAINTYPSFTMEAYIMDNPNSVNPNSNTMLAAFGNTTNGIGTDYYFLSVKSRAAITTNDYSAPWGDEDGYTAADLHDDGMAHHIVGVVTNDSLSLYLDGLIVGSTPLTGDNNIQSLSNERALLCGSLYTSDNTWLGSIYEFNIYAGVMDAQTVSVHSQAFPIETQASDATLSSIMLGDSLLSDFSPTKLEYTIVLPELSEIPSLVATTKIEGAIISVEKSASLSEATKITVTSLDQQYSVTYTIHFTTSTAVKTPEISNISVYPTMTQGDFTVETEGGSSTVSIYNLSGSLVKKQAFSSNMQTINIPNAGMYIMKIENQGTTKAFKVFKTK